MHKESICLARGLWALRPCFLKPSEEYHRWFRLWISHIRFGLPGFDSLCWKTVCVLQAGAVANSEAFPMC